MLRRNHDVSSMHYQKYLTIWYKSQKMLISLCSESLADSLFISIIPCCFLVTRSWLPFSLSSTHDDVIKWKHFPRNWPFVRGIHRSLVNSPHKSQWRGALMFSLIFVWINGWVNNREAGDLRRYLAHYDVTVMRLSIDTRWRMACVRIAITYSF